MTKIKKLFVQIGDVSQPLLERRTNPNEEYWYFYYPRRLGLHFSKHPTGLPHFKDAYGLTEDIDVASLRDLDSNDFLTDAQSFWYEREFEDRVVIMPLDECFLSSPLSENQHGMWLKANKFLKPLFGGIAQMHVIDNPKEGFLSELPTASLIFEESTQLVSIYHPEMRGLPPITLDSTNPLKALEQTRFGSILFPSIQKITRHIEELVEKGTFTPQELQIFEPQLVARMISSIASQQRF